LPVDLGSSPIDAPIPLTRFPVQSLKIGNSPGAETLPREHADFDFRLIEPASVVNVTLHQTPHTIPAPRARHARPTWQLAAAMLRTSAERCRRIRRPDRHRKGWSCCRADELIPEVAEAEMLHALGVSCPVDGPTFRSESEAVFRRLFSIISSYVFELPARLPAADALHSLRPRTRRRHAQGRKRDRK
jgi:hypothetical protein